MYNNMLPTYVDIIVRNYEKQRDLFPIADGFHPFVIVITIDLDELSSRSWTNHKMFVVCMCVNACDYDDHRRYNIRQQATKWFVYCL